MLTGTPAATDMRHRCRGPVQSNVGSSTTTGGHHRRIGSLSETGGGMTTRTAAISNFFIATPAKLLTDADLSRLLACCLYILATLAMIFALSCVRLWHSAGRERSRGVGWP